MDLQIPASPIEAVKRATDLADAKTGQYTLGTGDYRPYVVNGKSIDRPYTERERDHMVGCDCAGLICWAYKLRRHWPGFNRGGGFDVEDDLNCNSMIGDALGAKQCFVLATGRPQSGDILCYPSFYLYSPDGHRLKHDDGTDMHWIGHTGLVVGVSRVPFGPWDSVHPPMHLLDVVQVKGPDGRQPAAIKTDGSIWEQHAINWPRPQHTTYLLRTVGV